MQNIWPNGNREPDIRSDIWSDIQYSAGSQIQYLDLMDIMYPAIVTDGYPTAGYPAKIISVPSDLSPKLYLPERISPNLQLQDIVLIISCTFEIPIYTVSLYKFKGNVCPFINLYNVL